MNPAAWYRFILSAVTRAEGGDRQDLDWICGQLAEADEARGLLLQDSQSKNGKRLLELPEVLLCDSLSNA